jgi:hypothetical protein
VGRVVNALLGWATILLFGRVEARKQTILGFVVMASLAWVGALIGILVPDVGTILVAAVPRPDFISEEVVRLGMLGAVLVIPFGVGIVGVWLTDAPARPRGASLVTGVLRGYPFTALLAFMMAFLAAVAFVRRMNSLRRRWEDAHIPVIVKPGAYDRVVTELSDVLERAGITVAVREAPRVLSVPPRLLDRAAGRALGGMVPDHLMLLVHPELEILVYPADVAISGKRKTLARARAAIATRLTRAPAWLTASAEGQRIEDRLEYARGDIEARTAYGSAALAEIDRRLATTTIGFDEWETLYRMRLQMERDALQGGDQVAGTPTVPITPDPTPGSRRATGGSERPAGSAGGLIGRLGTAVSVASIVGLLALDVLLLVFRRDNVRPPLR